MITFHDGESEEDRAEGPHRPEPRPKGEVRSSSAAALLAFATLGVVIAQTPGPSSGPAAPVFADGQAQVVPAFQDETQWIRETLFVETELDSDADGKRDRYRMSARKEVATMFYDNENDSENKQRIKNGLFLKWWVKNTTRDAVLPRILVVAGILIVGVLLVKSCGLARL
jgi:hypothetical protein